MRTKKDFKEIYEMQIKNLKKEDKIRHLENIKFNIDMINRWDTEDNNAWEAVCELIIELKGRL